MLDYRSSRSLDKSVSYEKKEAIELRLRIQQLYFDQRLSKKEISRRLNVSKGFVADWTRRPRRDVQADDRGWPMGKHRTYDAIIVDRVRALHADLAADKKEFFTGATAIEFAWRERYPDEEIPSLRYIGKILSSEGLTKRQRGRRKGAASYLNYPEKTIYEHRTRRLLEADFIGQKYIRGRTEPLNFIGFSFKKTPRLRWYYQIESRTTPNVLSTTEDFFERFETPDAIKVDNDLAMYGSGSGKRSLSRFMQAMLKKEITPFFAVPRKPFTQASIEGNNSVFSRFFWNRHEFASKEEVRERLGWFNESSRRYCRYKRPSELIVRVEPYLPRVYFIRQVREQDERAVIEVTNDTVELDPTFVNYFVLAEWQPTNSILNVWFEKEQQAEQIASVPFEQNKRSRFKI